MVLLLQPGDADYSRTNERKQLIVEVNSTILFLTSGLKNASLNKEQVQKGTSKQTHLSVVRMRIVLLQTAF